MLLNKIVINTTIWEHAISQSFIFGNDGKIFDISPDFHRPPPNTTRGQKRTPKSAKKQTLERWSVSVEFNVFTKLELVVFPLNL